MSIHDNWEVIETEVLAFVKTFFKSGKFLIFINTTWVTLIPKYETSSSIDDSMHVSMISCLYKLESKKLATRLRRVIWNTIS